MLLHQVVNIIEQIVSSSHTYVGLELLEDLKDLLFRVLCWFQKLLVFLASEEPLEKVKGRENLEHAMANC